jgi:hypothetical protein
MKQIEKVINFGVGLILLNNLYLLSGFFHLSHLIVLAIVILFSIFYTIINWEGGRAIFLIHNWYAFFCLFFSILLYTLDYFLYESEARLNDVFRIIFYSFYFTWTFLLFKDLSLLLLWIKKLALASISILIIQGLFEYYQPYLWTLLLSSNVDKRTVGRIAGSLIDSNSYACSLLLFYFIVLKEGFKTNKGINNLIIISLFILILIFNDLSGSRQGVLLIVFFITDLVINNLGRKNLNRIVIGGVILFFIVALFNQQIIEYSELNPHSSIGRIIGSSDNKINQSNIDRQNSIYEGFLFWSSNYFVIGPGMIGFDSRWAGFTRAHEPHFGFLYLFAQLGALAFPIIYLYYKSYLRAKVVKVLLVFFSLILHLSLQPNTVYYGITFYIFFYVDIKYLNTFTIDIENNSSV